MLGLAGVTASETRVAGVTVSVTGAEETPPRVALSAVEPKLRELIKPAVPAALLMVATAGVAALQVTAVVRFWVLLSENVPVAVNCRVVPSAMLGAAGVMARETKAAELTVSATAGDVTPASDAVICAVPGEIVVARPWDPGALLIVAAPVAFQLTMAVRSCVLLSVKVPVAVNCSVVPAAMVGLAGVTPIDTSVAEPTVTVTAGEVMPLKAALTWAWPGAAAVTRPAVPAALLTAATAGVEDLQVTRLVRSCVWLSEYRPVAVNCRMVPFTSVGAAGVSPIETKEVAVTLSVVETDTPSAAAKIVAEPTLRAVTRPVVEIEATPGSEEV